MTDRTLRDRIAALTVLDDSDTADGWNGAIERVLRILDAHTAAQPAPDAVAEAPYICRTCRRTNPVWQLCNHPACADGR